MAVDYFLKLDGIAGESLDEAHRGEIEIESFSFGVSNVVRSIGSGGGAGAGKAVFQDFHFTTHTSKASPKLMLACASGQHIKTAVLACRKAGGEQGTSQGDFLKIERGLFYKISLTDVLVSSFQEGGSSADDLPADQVSLNFAKIQVERFLTSIEGEVVNEVQATWDLKKGQKV